MKGIVSALMVAAFVPALALAFTDYVDEYVDEVTSELEEFGIPVGDETDQPVGAPGDPAAPTPGDPAAPAPGDPASPTAPPGTKVKTDYSPNGAENTTLIVTSTPSAAPVTVDGRDEGHTPIYFTDLAPGRHTVKVAKVTDEVELRAGGITHLDVTCAVAPKDKDDDSAVAGHYVDNRDNYFELHIGNE